MITLFSKIFIKDDMASDKKRSLMGIICGVTGIILNVFLFVIKLIAGIISGSVSIVADSINNLSDAGSSMVTLISFKLSGHKADREHPFGHGRVEYIAGFITAVIIMAMGIELMKESVSKLIHPSMTKFSWLVGGILIASIFIKLYMAYYNNSVGKKLNSVSIKATAIDSISDCGATALTLVAALVGHFWGISIDGFAGVIVSCFIFVAGISAAGEAINPLLGSAPEPEFIDRIENIVMNFDSNVLGLHDLMVHDYGPGRKIISLHAEVPADGDIRILHDVVDNLEKKLETELGCVTTIHMDPIDNKNPEVFALKEKVSALVKEIHENLSIHDFRVVFGNTHTNLVFDAAVPFECELTNEEVVIKISQLVKKNIGNNYAAVINIDRDNYYNR